MSALSRFLMVTGGNVTGLTDELEKDGLVQRDAEPGDRRCYRVALTAKGRKAFEKIAANTSAGWSSCSAASAMPSGSSSTPCWAGCACSCRPRHDNAQENAVLMSTDPALLAGNRRPQAGYRAEHFLWSVDRGIGTITLNRPERKNPLTFDSYAELRDLFQRAAPCRRREGGAGHGAGGNFCSGGDVHEIIGPLIQLKAPELLMFTRMTGDLVKAMRHCPQPIVAAIDGVCAGAGAIITMASDIRYGTARSKTAFLFNRVGLAGCDMGACDMLPRIIGQGRASRTALHRPYAGRRRGCSLGLLQPPVCARGRGGRRAARWRSELRAGPTFANGITKTMLHQEWAMGIDQAIEAEAQAQALCMLTEDFNRAYHAFGAKQKPVFEGN